MPTKSGPILEFLTADYIVYSVGSRIKALSRDPLYKKKEGTDYATVMNAALDERELVGGKFLTLNPMDLTDTISIPDLGNHDFWLCGLGAHNTIITGAAGLDGPMIDGERTAWDSPSYALFLKVTSLGFDPNNLGTRVIRNNYGAIFLDDLFIIPNVPSDNKIIGRIGGSGGPSNPNYIGTIEMRYVMGVRDNYIFDVWVDNILVDNLSIVTNPSDDTKPLWYSPAGVQARINKLTYFEAGTGAMGSVIQTGSTTSIGSLTTIVGAGNHPTIDGIFRTSTKKITCELLSVGDPPYHPVYYDTASKKLTILGQFGGMREITGGNITAHGAGTIYQLFDGTSTSSATEADRALKVKDPFIVNELYGFLATAPGGTETKVFTLMKNGSPTAITFTITGVEIDGEDIAHEAEYAAGDTISVRVVGSVGAASTSLTMTKAEVNYLYRT